MDICGRHEVAKQWRGRMHRMNCFDVVSDLKIGHIVEVAGTTVRVKLSGDVTELSRTHEGRVYPIGQIGSVVKIHFGRQLVFGFVTLLRMRSEELHEAVVPIPPDADQRVMEVELFAEGVWNTAGDGLTFKRGVTTYPLPTHWWTQEQLSYMRVYAKNIMAKIVNEQLIKPMNRNFNKSSGPISIYFKGSEMKYEEPWISDEVNESFLFTLL